MTKKEYILDSLVDDDETRTQVMEYFKFVEVDISEKELDFLLNEMIVEGLITIKQNWKNERNEYPYSLTNLGRVAWKNIVQCSNKK